VDNQHLLGFGGYLTAALLGLIFGRIIIGIMGLVGPTSIMNKTADNMLTWFGTVLFAIFVAYDTQKLKEFNKNKSRNYVRNSLGLYLDILNLFSLQSH
jgi:FtsH-binding integral membrane protein